MKKQKKRRTISGRQTVTLGQLFSEPLPPAITNRINPLMFVGLIGVILTIGTAALSSTRGLSPFLALLTLVVLGYAIWLRYDVISRGYKEVIFKVIDYTYFTSLQRRPTGMMLVKYDQSEGIDHGNYHIAVSGKEDMPPIGWLIKVYVPKDAEPAEYSGRKYYPTVFGYALAGEETDYDMQS